MKSNHILVILVALAASTSCSRGDGKSSADDPLSHWISGASLPAGPRQDVAVVAIETTGLAFAFAIGGRDAVGNALETVERYTFALDHWDTIAPLPTPVYHANAVAFAGRIWVMGFLRADGTADGRVFWYNGVGDGWIEAPSMPSGTERGAAAIGAINGDDFVLVAGGSRSGQPVADLSSFAVVGSGGVWTVLPAMPEPRSEAAADAGSVLVVSGGIDEDGRATRDAFLFDHTVPEWTRQKNMPTARFGAAAFGGSQIIVIGGEGDSGVVSLVESYDQLTDSWKTRAPMITPRRGTGAAIIEDYCAIVPGGSVGSGIAPVDTVELLCLELPPGTVR